MFSLLATACRVNCTEPEMLWVFEVVGVSVGVFGFVAVRRRALLRHHGL